MTSNWAWTIYILFSYYTYRHFPACLYWVLSALMTTWSVRVTLDYCSSLNGAPRWRVSSSYYHRQWNPSNLSIDTDPPPPHTHSHFCPQVNLLALVTVSMVRAVVAPGYLSSGTASDYCWVWATLEMRHFIKTCMSKEQYLYSLVRVTRKRRTLD